MLRIFVQYVLPLLLPFLVYLLYAWLAGRARWLEDGPWVGLTAAGIGLLAVSLVSWNLLTGASPDANYVPAHMEDGRLVPGRTVAD